MQIIKIEPIIDILKSKQRISDIVEIGSSETTGIKGVNKSWKVTNKNGEEFLFKPRKLEHISRWRQVPAYSLYRRERAAFLIDQKLGFNIVPETTIKKYIYNGDKYIGSFQRWIQASHDVDVTLKKYSLNTIWKVGLFDIIIGQIDRHKNNWLDYDHTVAAIDNGFSMPIRAEENDPRSVILSRFAYRIWNKEIPEKFLEKIKLLKDSKFQNHIKNLLELSAFQLFNERIDQLLNNSTARVKGYYCVEKLRGIPKKKEDNWKQ